MKSNIINKYGTIQSLFPIRSIRGTIPHIILEIIIIKIGEYKLNKRWCRWYFDIDNKRYYFKGKLLKISKPHYGVCGEYVLEIKCEPNNYSKFANKILKHDDVGCFGWGM